MVRWLPVYCYRGLLLARATLNPSTAGDVPLRGHLAGRARGPGPVAGNDLESRAEEDTNVLNAGAQRLTANAIIQLPNTVFVSSVICLGTFRFSNYDLRRGSIVWNCGGVTPTSAGFAFLHH